MLQDDTYGGIRVKIQGVVGSPPRLLPSRAFVILNPEGRGLSIHLPTGQLAPAMDTEVMVTGTLKFDTHEFTYLSMAKNDIWTKVADPEQTPARRAVAWSAPATEDAWSLVAATGTVQSVTGNTISLTINDADVDVKIKPGVAYRVTRLKKGDVIQVAGLLDMTSDRLAILPRNADEIVLISHAPEKIETAKSSTPQGLPGWTPFGAALGAIGAIGGVKKLRTRKKQEVNKVAA